MALHCPNCGEANLRDNARFCDSCGANLIADDSATMLLPHEPTDQANATRAFNELTSFEDDGATRVLADSHETDGGATRQSPAFPHNQEKSLDGDVAESEGATRLLSDSEPEDDGLTIILGDEGDGGDIHQTTKLPAAPEPDAPPQDAPSPRIIQEPLQKRLGFKPGQILNQRYRLERILGHGGFGAVYLAEDLILTRRCVVKQMVPRSELPRAIEAQRISFEKEAKLLADLNDPGHPNIPEIFDYFSNENGNYLVMKFIDGQSLNITLKLNEGKLPWREAARYAIDVCGALDYMHTHGKEPVMHRDVKPANILLGSDDRVWLVDFGLATTDVSEQDDALQGSGSVGYAPLEQWFGEPVPASDIYAIGATLHHMVTGVDPFDAFEGQFSIEYVYERHAKFVPIRAIDKSLSKDLEATIAQAVAADAEDRPTALQLQKQLEVLVTGGKEAALFTFRNGKSANTIEELVDLCDQNRREAQGYLYKGEFERWFLLINRNDLALAATQALKQGQNQRDGLEKFLKIIYPNLQLRRLKKGAIRAARVGALVIFITLVVITGVFIAGSYGARWFIQRSLGSLDWNFYTLDLDRENRFTETFINQKFNDAAEAYFDDKIQVDLQPPDQMKVSASWRGIPLDIPASLRLENNRPHFHLTEVSGIPLYIITDNISQGLNAGADDAFEKGPVDLTRLEVEESAVVFEAKLSGRAPFATPTPTVTPTPTPSPTPTPVNNTLVVIFNKFDQDLVLELRGNNWNQVLKLAAGSTEVIEPPPGTYTYTIKYPNRDDIVDQGQQTWDQNRAYRLGIGLAEDRE